MKRFSSKKTKNISVYSNLSRRRAKKDLRSRRRAEYLASLPKDPFKRLLYKLHPKRVLKFWFSREGAILGAKIIGVFMIIMAIIVGGLFAYFRRELSAISPEELAKRVQTTITRYYDRNGILLWEDKGTGDYTLVVKSEEMGKYIKQATVAIEDKDFYKHGGVSFTGIMRAGINDLKGGSTQGGSTLTQQLIKQVFFADQAGNRGLNGVPRKIKEMILAIEVERMYNKDQILTMYLNESPYGGRRNGVESASQDYFGKSTKDLTLAEAALLASVPNQPGLYNPRNVDGNKDLIERQHIVLDKMAEQGYVTKAQAEEAKKVAVLDELKPEQTTTAKAPHFVKLVQEQLNSELGESVVGKGGLTVKTTLDIRAQEAVEKSISDTFSHNLGVGYSSTPEGAGFDNAAATVVDTQTGQIIAMQGSRDYNYPGYGETNSALSPLSPGSSIKPFVYAALMQQKSGTNYGAGSILSDNPMPQSVYSTDDGKPLANFDNRYLGLMTLRNALPQSRNVPAVWAMYYNEQASGQGSTLKSIRDFGDKSYCELNEGVGLGLAIGGCQLKQIDHVTTFATLARMGVYKPYSTVLEVKNNQDQIIKQWKDDGGKQVLDPQVAYILSDVLSDGNARAPSFGAPNQYSQRGLILPGGIKTGVKTGTSNIGTRSGNLWVNSYSPAITASFFVGNHDGRAMNNALSSALGATVESALVPIYNIYQADGRYKAGDWYSQPAGIKTFNAGKGNDLFPSWYNNSSAALSNNTIVFDDISKKKATNCTPEKAKISKNVQGFKDPATGKTVYQGADGYDPNADDDVHKCDDVKPYVSASTDSSTAQANQNVTISLDVGNGTHPLQSLTVTVNGNVVSTQDVSGGSARDVTFRPSAAGTYTIVATISDNVRYESTSTVTVTVSGGGGGGNTPSGPNAILPRQ